ncbi:MAG: conjugative transfer signal peptidase TraF [Succinatimonas sp.]|jgi:conjugative transfer signal peptidase TraF|nr:conjugative transfer signal peptidase TraF [Succinatimonas sp.]MDY5722504.1 conjugative transfer signal peptidase TraF [Succinivibrio sp.]
MKSSYTNLLTLLLFSITIITVSISLFMYILPYRYNTTSSLPKGWYQIIDKEPELGDIILFCIQGEVAKLASERAYLDTGKCEYGNAPIGKRIVATTGDHVVINDRGIEVNDRLIDTTKPGSKDAQNRLLPKHNLDTVLKDDEFIVASQKQDSFDSRYFGIVRKDQIEGVIKKL